MGGLGGSWTRIHDARTAREAYGLGLHRFNVQRPAPMSQATFGSAGMEVRVEKTWCAVHKGKDRCWRKRYGVGAVLGCS